MHNHCVALSSSEGRVYGPIDGKIMDIIDCVAHTVEYPGQLGRSLTTADVVKGHTGKNEDLLLPLQTKAGVERDRTSRQHLLQILYACELCLYVLQRVKFPQPF